MSNILATIVVKYAGNSTSNFAVESDPELNILDPDEEPVTIYEYSVMYARGDIDLQQYLGYLTGEADSEVKTTFVDGDEYYFLVHNTGTTGTIKKVTASAGDITSYGEVEQDRSDVLDFIEPESTDNKPSVSYRKNGAVEVDYWVGNEGVGVYVNDDLSANITGGDVPCKCKVTYPVLFNSFKLTPPSPIVFPEGSDSFEIIILVEVE